MQAGSLGKNIIKYQEGASENRINCVMVSPLPCEDLRLLCEPIWSWPALGYGLLRVQVERPNMYWTRQHGLDP